MCRCLQFRNSNHYYNKAIVKLIFLLLGSKKFKKKSVNKLEELPSFLLNLKSIPEDIFIPTRPKKRDNYLGPIFFGECIRHHPPHSSVPLGSFHHMQIFVPSEENILKDVFLPESKPEKKFFESKTFHPVIRSKKVFDDPFPHKCPGVRKVFAPDNFLSEGLGETKSVIEGETSREIPLCRFKKIWDICNPEIRKTEVEVVTLSDIREEKRKFLSEKERIAHAHFPKEFLTVRVIGPTIPESITITKLPSKRQTQYEIDPHLKLKTTKTSDKKAGKNKENLMEVAPETKKEEEGLKESILSLLVKKESSIEERIESENMWQQSEVFKEESGLTKSQILSVKEEGEKEERERESIKEEEEEEETKEREQEQEKSQVFADGEKESTLGDVEEDNHHETAED